MKIISIQILRGGAALMVVFHHFFQIFFNHNTSNDILNFLSYHMAMGVDIFFVISGFIMAYIINTSPNLTFRNFILNRIVRIVPNYWFYTGVILFIGLFIEQLHVNNQNLHTILMSLFFISHLNPTQSLGYTPTLTVGWTLNFEVLFYFLIGLTLFYSRSSSLKKLLLATISIISIVFLYKLFKFDFYSQIIGQIRLLEFACGILIFILRNNFMTIFENKKLLFLGFVICYLILIFDKLAVFRYITISSFLIYVALFYENFFFKFKNSFIIKSLYFNGEISYSIYLAHSIVLLVIFNVFQNTNYYLSFIISLVLIYGVSILSYKWIEVYFSNQLRK